MFEFKSLSKLCNQYLNKNEYQVNNNVDTEM